MSIRGLSYLNLWTVHSHIDDLLWAQLKKYLIASARYLGVSHNESLNLSHRMPVRKAIDELSATLGMSNINVSTPLRGLPIIARSHQSNALVLLLPKGPDYFLVFDFSQTKVKRIKASKVSNNFSECVQFFRTEYTNLINEDLRSYFPKSIIIIASIFKIIVLVLSAILALMLLEEDLSQNKLILFVFSLLALLFGVVTHILISRTAEKNLFLVFLWARWQFYYSIFYFDLERYSKTSWARVERVLANLSTGVKKYFLITPQLIISYVILALNALFLLWFNKYFLIFFIIILSAAYLAAHMLGQYISKLRQRAVLDEESLDQALVAFKLSFAMAVGLKAQNFLITRINKLCTQLRKQSNKISLVHAYTHIGTVSLSLTLLWLLSLYAQSWSLPLGCALIINAFLFAYALNNIILVALLPQPRPLSNAVLHELSLWSPDFSKRVQPVNIRGSIELHDISFAYNQSSILVIKNASILFNAQKFYALVGPSGSGKSTLLKLLMAQEIAQEGHVAFDGQDARSLEPTLLRQYFGVVNQESKAFAGSIRSNIVCGRDIVTRDLEHLLYSHEVFDVLLDLPMGLETYIFDRAANISRLQLVVLLLARALVHKPKILFLDEIFKGLNLEQQAIIINYLESLDITRILVTHDLALLKPDFIIKQNHWNAR